MFVQMVCSCESELSVDTEDNQNSLWFLVFRFANAHVACGYMTDGTSDDEPGASTPKKRIIKPRRSDPPEEP